MVVTEEEDATIALTALMIVATANAQNAEQTQIHSLNGLCVLLKMPQQELRNVGMVVTEEDFQCMNVILVNVLRTTNGIWIPTPTNSGCLLSTLKVLLLLLSILK